MTVFVEHLTLRTWIRWVLPYALRHRERQSGDVPRCWVFDGSRMAMAVARGTGRLAGLAVERLRFRLVDIRDEEGCLLRLRIAYQDLAEVQQAAMREPAFAQALRAVRGVGRVPAYLAKALATVSLWDRATLWRALVTIQVCAWTGRRTTPQSRPVYVMERRPWMASIMRYAVAAGVTVLPVPRRLSVGSWMRQQLPLVSLEWLRYLRAVVLQGWRAVRQGRRSPSPRSFPRLAVEYYGYLNVQHPERYSDLFFWQSSSLRAEDVVMLFTIRRDPLDAEKWAALARQGIAAVALDPQATTVASVPVFLRRPRRHPVAQQAVGSMGALRSDEARWLRRQLERYGTTRSYWEALFARYGVKVYVSWYRFTPTQCAIADAMERLGGVTAIYQRSFESFPQAEAMTTADVVFSYSQAAAEVERRAQSVIRYHVVTGYLGDHRFAAWRSRAHHIREALHQQGATRILAYCDENSVEDSRWHTGHEFMRENYQVLLEHVLAEPWLGLVCKPKAPATLRRRLGPVAKVLEHAEATGRCLVLSEGTIAGALPPVAAALAADVTVHGHLCGATAGVEAALAGARTLLLDREGWPRSPFYDLGVGRVVFRDWPSLWQACLEHWQRPDGIPGFGDWSAMLPQLDPFRDGRAAQRMGTYLQWLVEGLQAGRPRETVMADAAEQYASRWGRDKVTSINVAPSADGRWDAGRERLGAAPAEEVSVR